MRKRPVNAPKEVRLPLYLESEQEAWDLAQFCKRLSFRAVRDCAVDDQEAYRMMYALAKVSAALREAGYAPR